MTAPLIAPPVFCTYDRSDPSVSFLTPLSTLRVVPHLTSPPPPTNRTLCMLPAPYCVSAVRRFTIRFEHSTIPFFVVFNVCPGLSKNSPHRLPFQLAKQRPTRSQSSLGAAFFVSGICDEMHVPCSTVSWHTLLALCARASRG